MKNTKWMKEMTSAELAEAIKNGTDTVIIPGGAYEVYGPQLPLGSDTIVSLAVCERVAAKTNAIIGPCFEVGESASLYQFPGTIKIMPDTNYRVMEDIIDSLASAIEQMVNDEEYQKDCENLQFTPLYMDPTKVAEYETEYYDFLNGMADTIQSDTF